MKNIKYKIFGLLVLTALAGSCGKDDLELTPISSISEEQFFNTDSDILGAVIAIYDGLQAVPLKEFTLTEMRSDNAKSFLGEGEYKQLETFDVQPTNSVVNTYWSVNYNVIYRSNVVLKNIDVMTDQAKKANYIGEAKFARALAHFNLVRAFGDVPLIDKVIGITDQSYFAKKSADEVYALIESDLTEAVELLPVKSATVFGRASKQAAQGILAKVYLTRQNYSAALPLLTALVNDASYSLRPIYRDVFYVEKNDEILFAIPYAADSNTESQDFSYEMTTAGGLDFVTPNFTAFMDANPLDVARRAVNINPANVLQNGKWITSASAVRLSGNDWIVLRLADVYLMYTEAVMGTANETSDALAVQYYDRVRNRSYVTPVTHTTITKEMLLNERRSELAFENHRLYDLIRFGQAETVLSAYSPTFQAPKDLLLPIPQTQINVSSGILVQNPLYN